MHKGGHNQHSPKRNISKLEEIHFWAESAQTGAYGESLGGLVQAERGNHNQIACPHTPQPALASHILEILQIFSHFPLIFS